MGWLKRVWEFVRRLPVARYIRPLWQAMLVELVQREGDDLQKRVREVVALEGPAGVDRLVDGWQDKLHRGAAIIPLPALIREAFRRIVFEWGDKIQENIKTALKTGGPPAVDSAFDAAQTALIARLRAL